ncbi:MAG: twin-arginine translocase TatA/TatE family subunit [Phycisphaerales bacterium]|nr:twin-arginine translocase TatA/TatE family subunit [Planctomycetota bacterium]
MTALAFINDLLSPGHLIILLVIGLLFFGRRLPEVGRSLGRSIVEFKKGLKGVDDEIDEQVNRQQRRDPYVDGGYRAPLESQPPRQDRPRAEPAAARSERPADDPQ